MSRNVYIGYRGNGFWTFDTLAPIFGKHLIDAAVKATPADDNHWLTEWIELLRVDVICTDLGFHFDEDWPPAKLETVVELCRQAVATIRARPSFSRIEVESWVILDGEWRINSCRFDVVPTEWVARLGDCIADLLQGRLPQPPGCHSWQLTYEGVLTPKALRDTL